VRPGPGDAGRRGGSRRANDDAVVLSIFGVIVISSLFTFYALIGP
jgi:hypothetical protein